MPETVAAPATSREQRAGRRPGSPALAGLAILGSLLAALVLLVAAPASAHAVLEGSTPAADAVLKQAPTSVSLLFGEPITLLDDSVRVFGPDGSRVDTGKPLHTHGDSATAGVALRSDLPDGTYLVSYRVISADSHPVSGAYQFVVGHPSRTSVTIPTGAGGSRSVEVALGVARWLSFVGSALGLGGIAFLVWCWPTGWGSRRARLVVGIGVLTLAVGTLLMLLLKGAYDEGLGLGSVTRIDLLREVLATTYGRALDVRLFLVAVVVLLLTYRDRIPARWLVFVPGVLLAATGLTFALCGHAAAGGHRALALLSDTVHLASMSVWLGGLVMLLGALFVRGADRDEVTRPVLRFSNLAAGAVSVLIATGIYQSLREVRSFDVLLHAHYGHLLLIKLAVVAAALFAAAGSRAWVWRVVNPTVEVHAATEAPPEPSVDRRPGVGRLRVSVALETTMILAVLAVTAMLVTSNPDTPAPQTHPVSTRVSVGPDRVQVSATPSGQRGIALRLQVTAGSGRPTEPREIDASLALASSQIGPLPVRLTPSGRGVRTGTITLPVSGDWQLAVTVRTSAIDEATAYVSIPVG